MTGMANRNRRAAMTRWLIFAVPLLLFVALAVLLLNRNGEDPTLLPSARLGEPVPAFQLPALADAGRELDAGVFKGQVSLLNVWATWCSSCEAEHPMLMQLARAGVLIIGVNYKDDRQAALGYLAAHGDPYAEIVSDAGGDFGLDLGVYGAPETYLVDRDGHVRYRVVGVLDEQVWQRELQPRYAALRAGQPLPGDKP